MGMFLYLDFYRDGWKHKGLSFSGLKMCGLPSERSPNEMASEGGGKEQERERREEGEREGKRNPKLSGSRRGIDEQ